MLVEEQIAHFLKRHYKEKIMHQIPQAYNHHQALLTLAITIDLTKVFCEEKQIALFIISNYPFFYEKANSSILQLIEEQGLIPPEHGLHLLISLTNCPMPQHNIQSPEFISALVQQKQGVLVYLKQAYVLEVSQPQLYLKVSTEIWAAKCKCEVIIKRVEKRIRQNLLGIVKNNTEFRRFQKRNPPICSQCSSSYCFLHEENEIYLNCHKVKLALKKKSDTLFQSGTLDVYVEQETMNKIEVGNIMNCCVFLLCRLVLNKSPPELPINIKTSFSAYLVSSMVHIQGKSLLMRSRNNEFFSQLRKINIDQRKCQNLSDFDAIIFNYNSLMEAISSIKFPYLPEATLTLFKLSLLNSIFNHHNNIHLHLCIVADEQGLITNAMKLKNLEVKKWPNQYDQSTMITWLRNCANQIIILSNPKKKDLQLVENILTNKIDEIKELNLTFWIVAEESLKKQINMEHFGISLDLTFEKNIYVCSNIFEDSIDLTLSAFLLEEKDQLWTAHKVQNHQSRFSLFQEEPKLIREERQKEQKEKEDRISRDILQRYYMKSREYKKTSSTTLNHLIDLATGFSCMREFFSIKKWPSTLPELTILDSVLVIFLDEESSRNKYSTSNTLFTNQISKLILNENNCEISFWDYEYSDDGTMREVKNYLPKPTMLKRMLHKINNLLYGDGLVVSD